MELIRKPCAFSDDNPLRCLQTAVPDKNGIRHLLLCRVILGKSEVVHPGSRTRKECHPSSENMIQQTLKGMDFLLEIKIPWITFPTLISALSKFLPPQTVKLITKYHSDHKHDKGSTGNSSSTSSINFEQRDFVSKQWYAQCVDGCNGSVKWQSPNADSRGIWISVSIWFFVDFGCLFSNAAILKNLLYIELQDIS
ncbi:hypothetical protein HAX54_034191 [Datura stramonium]|uniref:RST domain-containing protein n=1 Tax=Datura stramonium TaxID=4076 RepID=A0ABS8VEY7_DATST|nr:hypothetical protein [Datura stramonium]